MMSRYNIVVFLRQILCDVHIHYILFCLPVVLLSRHSVVFIYHIVLLTRLFVRFVCRIVLLTEHSVGFIYYVSRHNIVFR